jgi:hypothetical protein
MWCKLQGAATLSIMTFRITTLSLKIFLTTLKINDTQHIVTLLFIVLRIVVMLNVMPSVVMLRVRVHITLQSKIVILW